MSAVGQTRQIEFWIADTNNHPVTNCTLSSFSITFVRNGSPCADALALSNLGGGAYVLSYKPSAAGRDDIRIDDAVNDLHYRDIEVIGGDASSNLVSVTQDYGGVHALVPPYPDLARYVLHAFRVEDWLVGRTDPAFALGSYQLDSTGNWSLSLLPGTYALILSDGAGTDIVFQTDLVVT